MSDILDRYRMAVMKSLVFLSGSPYDGMEEGEYSELSETARLIIDGQDGRMKYASRVLRNIVEDDPVTRGIHVG